jgi:hypothetical protein
MLLKMLGTTSGAGGCAANALLPGIAATELLLVLLAVSAGEGEGELPKPKPAAAVDALGRRFVCCSSARRSGPAGWIAKAAMQSGTSRQVPQKSQIGVVLPSTWQYTVKL